MRFTAVVAVELPSAERMDDAEYRARRLEETLRAAELELDAVWDQMTDAIYGHFGEGDSDA